MHQEQAFVYDLVAELRRDPSRRRRVEAAMSHLEMITELAAAGKASRQDITRAEADLVPLCGFNFGVLIPRVFPRYPRDEPLDFFARPFMFAMTTQAPNSVVTVKAGRQVGKCADGDTEVLTNAGVTTLRGLFDEGVPVLSTAR